MDEEHTLDGSDKSFTRSWKLFKGAFKKRLEPKSRRSSVASSHSSEANREAQAVSRSSSSSVKQRFTKGPLGALYKPKPFKVPSAKALLDEVGGREGSQFEMMLDRALSLKRHDSMDLMWRSGDLGLFGGNTQSVSEEDDQVRELIHTERLIVKRASGRAIVNKQYLVVKTLGSGQYGKVQLVVNVADLQPYAIKTVSKAKLRTSIRRIRSSLSRHSYGNLNMAASQAVASVDGTSDPPDSTPEAQRAPPPPPSCDSSPSPSSAASSAPSSPFAGMPNLPGDELFTSAPPNSRFGGGGSKRKLQPVAEAPASTVAASTSSLGTAPASSGPPAAFPAQRTSVSPFTTRGKAKIVSPFAAAAKESSRVLTQDSATESPASPSMVSPRLRSSLGLSPVDVESSSLGTSFGRSAPLSPREGFGFGDMGPSVTPRHSLAERPMPGPSVERIAQLRGFGARTELEPDSSSFSPRAERGAVPRPSLEHIAHLRGIARATSTPNTGLADSFSMTRSASIRATPRAADVVQEIAVMKKLNHPNIVRLHEVIDDPSTDSLLLVMEHVDGGSLEQPYDSVSKTWDTLPESLVHRHFTELCKGLDYLHFNKALHGDLKPANLLLSSERLVKIADFGSAMMYQESEGTWEGPVNGTPAFRPPETLTASGRLTRKVLISGLLVHATVKSQESYAKHAAAMVDVWAAGVCLYVWVWGCLPFQGDSIPDMFTAIKQKPLTFPAHPDCHPHLKDLITKILMKEPEQRLSLHEVMQHPWVTQNGACPVPTVAASGLQTVHVTSQDVRSAISSQNRPSVPTLQSIFKEVNFGAGEVLGSDGTDGEEYIYLIAQGQVDVLRSTSSGTSEMADADADDDIADDSHCEMSGKSVTELVSNLRCPFEGEGHVWLATRGPGEFVGLHSLAKERTSRQTGDSEQSETFNATVIKARTDVSAFQAPKDAVAAAMSQHPELADALQSKVIQHMADQTVAEAISALHMGQTSTV